MDKRPRHYAIDCLRLETKQDRQHYLEHEVPAEFREWVKKYVIMWWPRRKTLI